MKGPIVIFFFDSFAPDGILVDNVDDAFLGGGASHCVVFFGGMFWVD